MNSVPPNKHGYLAAKRDFLKVAFESNQLPIPAIGNFNYCGTSITSFNTYVPYNTNGISDCNELLEIIQQR